MYDGELEDAFNDFSDLTTNFPLYRGKGKRDPDDPKGQVVGLFKGALKVYPIPDDGSPEPPKVLANLPSTKPVNVLVRIYVIRVGSGHLINSVILCGWGMTLCRVLNLPHKIPMER